jgi:hypothetical protein
MIMIVYIILWEYVLGRTSGLARGMLVLVGFLQLLLEPIFDQIFNKTIEISLLWSEHPLSLGNDHN